MGDLGARKVARAFMQGIKLRCGNAYTDGQSYFLFGKEIARHGAPRVEQQVKARLLGEDTKLLHVSWAGWATQSTARHLNAVLAEFGPGHRARYHGRKAGTGTPYWSSGNGDSLMPAYINRWYSIKELP